MISVFSASSQTGRACLTAVAKQRPDVAVRAVFRTAEKASAAAPWLPEGPEVLTGVDAYNTADLARAYEGADVAVVVTPHDMARGFADDAMLTQVATCAVLHCEDCNLPKHSHLPRPGSYACAPMPMPTSFLAPRPSPALSPRT